MGNRVIRERIYLRLKVKLESPLSVSSGTGRWSDRDVMRNADKECFIPGTSLAGAFRDCLNLPGGEKGIMGFSDGENGQMSSIYISDLYFDQVPLPTIRDGVALNEDKTVKETGKFDMEIIETGAEGWIFLNYIVREGEERSEYEKAINVILFRINNGELRFGGSKNRGFGRLKILTADRRIFCKENLPDYIKFKNSFKDSKKHSEFYNENFSVHQSAEKEGVKKWFEQSSFSVPQENEYIRITVPLKLNGGISIRRYSSEPGKADYSHITCAGDPVIPGRSWNGAIRSDVRRILQDAGVSPEKTQEFIDDWFGSKKQTSGKKGNKNTSEAKEAKKEHQSRIVIGESIIKDASNLVVTRNQINRIDASTVNGALYTESSFFGGTTELELMVKKDKDGVYKTIVPVLELVIQDIQNGFLAVGGLTAVGRGLFEPDPDKKIVFSEEVKAEWTPVLEC